MIYMKKISCFLLGIGLSLMGSSLFAQADIADHIRLDIRYYMEDGESYLGVSPELKIISGDPLSQGMTRYPRRFRYLLLNKTRFQNIYEKYYPDTLKINKLFTDSLMMDQQFVNWYGQLSSPFTGATVSTLRFSRKQLMQVASKFFYCQAVRADSSIASTICIGRNGLDGLPRTPDLTLLEAFCFEAIFERYYSNPGVKSQFIENFLGHINEAVKRKKPSLLDRQQYLLEIREYCFKQMEKDSDLEKVLLDYYKEHARSFSFVLD